MNQISLKDIFSADVTPPAIILVEGEAGTLKSTLCFGMMLNLLAHCPDSHGLYMTFEQTWQSHVSNMISMGYQPPGSLHSVDYNIMRKEAALQQDAVNVFTSITGMIDALYNEKKGNLSIFALDSLNAVYSIAEPQLLESSLIPFFRKLREYNMISLIINECQMDENNSHMRERFLADGIVSLGILRRQGEVSRYLQALKFSQGEHSLRRRQVVLGRDGIKIQGEVYR